MDPGIEFTSLPLADSQNSEVLALENAAGRGTCATRV